MCVIQFLITSHMSNIVFICHTSLSMFNDKLFVLDSLNFGTFSNEQELINKFSYQFVTVLNSQEEEKNEKSITCKYLSNYESVRQITIKNVEILRNFQKIKVKTNAQNYDECWHFDRSEHCSTIPNVWKNPEKHIFFCSCERKPKKISF